MNDSRIVLHAMAHGALDPSRKPAIVADGAAPYLTGPLSARVDIDTPWWRAEIMAAGGRWQRLHSIRDPLAEARAQASAIPIGASRTVVLLGCGLGYLPEVLLDARDDLRVVAIEPSLELARSCRSRRDWDAPHLAGRFELRRWPDLDAPAPLWQLFDCDEPEPIVVAHPVVERELPQLVAALRARVSRIIFDGRANAEARRRQAGRYLLNSIHNLDALAGSTDVAALGNAFADVPAVIVAAGPSLDAQVESLRRITSKALVIAVDTSLRPLANAGVRPHLAVALDPTDLNARHLIDLPDVSDTWLVAEPSLSPAAIAPFTERLFTFRVADHHPWPWLTEIGLGRHLLRVWGSVLTAGLDLAIFTGANPIAFVGADLALTGGRPYCRGAIWENDWAKATGRGQGLAQRFADDLAARPIEYVEDLHRRPTPTTPHLLAFRNWLLERMREAPDRRFVNASGDGILFGDPIARGSLDAMPSAPEAAGLRDRIRQLASARVPGDRRRELASALRHVRDGDTRATLKIWSVFGSATVSETELNDAIERTVQVLDADRVEPAHVTPSPAGLLPAADRAAVLHAALVGVSANVTVQPADREELRRTFRQLQELLTSAAVQTGSVSLTSVAPGDVGRVPASLLFDLRGPGRDTLVEFEDALARLCQRAGIANLAAPAPAGVPNDPCAPVTLPLLAAPVLTHEWLSVARLLAAEDDDGIAATHWVLSGLLRAWSRHGDNSTALELTVGDIPPFALPSAREWPARELTGIVGVGRGTKASSRTAPPVAVRRPHRGSHHDAAENDPSSHPWLQLFDGATFRLTPERLSHLAPAGLATTLSETRALVTPANALASVEINSAGEVFERRPWPRPIWGEIPFGPDGGALAWHNPDRVVLVRMTAGGAADEFAAPFRPLRVAVGPDGVPIWCAFEGGLWGWAPGGKPRRLIETPIPIHLHIAADGVVRVDAATRADDGAAIRRRIRTAWQWQTGASQLQPIELGDEGQCTSTEIGGGWRASAHPYADLVLIRTPDDRQVSLGVFYPLTVAWAGSSLIVCSGEGDVLLFRDITARLTSALQ